MSEIRFHCSNCQAKISADSSLAGTHVECPSCNTTIQVPLPRLKEGVQIAGFKVEKLLGTGAMGEVWLAYQPSMDRKVALKILAPQLTRDPEFVSRFMEEVKTAGKLEHPNIVTAFHAGEENGIYFLAVSYIEGIEVSKKLEKEGILDEKEALNIAKGVAQALKYAWDEFKILHRDIKPSNIMIDKTGTPKLMDMGISKSMAKSSSITLTGTILGTPFYMSPEQAQAERELDCRADIYALGITLFELLTGEVPFSASSPMAILYKHIHDPLPSPREKNPKISRECEALIKIMTSKKKEDRQQTWDEVIRDIECVLNGKFPETKSQEFIYEKEKNVRETGIKKVLLTGAAIAACFVFFIIFLISSVSHKTARNKKEKPSSPFTLAKPSDVHQHQTQKNELASQKPNTNTDASASAPTGKHPSGKISQLSEKKAKEMFDFAVSYVKKNPHSFKVAMSNFDKIRKLFPDTKYGLMANAELIKLKKKRRKFMQEKINKILSRLKQTAQTFINKHQYEKAITLVRSYSGEFAKETALARKQLCALYKNMQKHFKQQQKQKRVAAEQAYQKYLSELASEILRKHLKTALKVVDKTLKNKDVRLHQKRIIIHKNILTALLNINNFLLDEFKANIGKKVVIETKTGRKIYKVKKVKGKNIYVETETIKNIKVQTILPLKTISIKEKIRVLSKKNSDAAILAAAISAFSKKHYPKAVEILKKLKEHDLAGTLIKKIYEKQSDKALDFVKKTILDIMIITGNPVEKFSISSVKSRINALKSSSGDLPHEQTRELSKRIKELLNSPQIAFLRKHYDSEKIKQYISLLTELSNALNTDFKTIKILKTVIHADIKKFDSKTLAIEMIYDFTDETQLADWRLIPIERPAKMRDRRERPFRRVPDRFASMKIVENQLIIFSGGFSILRNKIRFARLKVKVSGYYTYGNYGLFLTYRGKSLVFIVAGEGDKDAYIIHEEGDAGEPEINILGNTQTKHRVPFLTYLFWNKNFAKLVIQTYEEQAPKKHGSSSDENMKTISWDPIPFNGEWVTFGMAVKRSKNFYDKIHIKAILDRRWVKRHLPQILKND